MNLLSPAHAGTRAGTAGHRPAARQTPSTTRAAAPAPATAEQDTGGAAVVEVSGLRMRYGEVDVLRGVDLQVHAGQVLALLGPNGAGKTSTLEVLEGFRRRSAGRVRVLGVDPDDADERWRARIGVVLQSWQDHRRWRVRDLLHHLGRHYRPYGTPQRPRPCDTDELLARVGLLGQATQVVGKLSGGQRRRLDVAVGLVGRPELLFLDEPTVGFDPQARREFHTVVRELAERDGTSIVLTTHDLAEAEALSDTIALLAGGRVAACGTSAELAARYAGTSTVTCTLDGRPHRSQVTDPAEHLRQLLAEGDVADLQVRRASLEDAYLAMVDEFEGGRR